jgi:hypothetical protein
MAVPLKWHIGSITAFKSKDLTNVKALVTKLLQYAKQDTDIGILKNNNVSYQLIDQFRVGESDNSFCEFGYTDRHELSGWNSYVMLNYIVEGGVTRYAFIALVGVEVLKFIGQARSENINPADYNVIDYLEDNDLDEEFFNTYDFLFRYKNDCTCVIV